MDTQNQRDTISLRDQVVMDWSEDWMDDHHPSVHQAYWIMNDLYRDHRGSLCGTLVMYKNGNTSWRWVAKRSQKTVIVHTVHHGPYDSVEELITSHLEDFL